MLVKDLIEVAAPITYGAFSPDFTKLVIGDGSGRVYLLALEDTEVEDPPVGASAGVVNVPTDAGGHRAVRRPRPFTPHPELAPPSVEDHNIHKERLMDGQKKAREYLHTAKLVRHPDPTVGVVQGINYEQTGLYRVEAHIDKDPHGDLISPFASKQQDQQHSVQRANSRRTRVPRRKEFQDRTMETTDGWPQEETTQNIDQYRFDPATWQQLKAERAEIDDSLIELDYETSIPDSDEEYDW